MDKHTTSQPAAAVVLAFGPTGRQSSRRTEPARRVKPFNDRAQRIEARRLAKALGVTETAIGANGARLYYMGPDLLTIEAAYKMGKAQGRVALLAALGENHDLGYEVGLGDGAMRVAR